MYINVPRVDISNYVPNCGLVH